MEFSSIALSAAEKSVETSSPLSNNADINRFFKTVFEPMEYSDL